MSILKGSRYEYSTVDFIPTKVNGPQNAYIMYTFNPLDKTVYSEHVFTQGERLDQIANKYYKNPYSWWLIAESNPEIVDFTNIQPGTRLRIPRV
jgi:nucleoid-associated protein YgaU